MKKLIAFLLAAGMLQAEVYANINSFVTECGTDGSTAITGTLDKSDIGSLVGIRVLKKDAVLSELTGDPAADLAITEFVDQTDVSAGETEFSLRFYLPDGETGHRLARLKGNAADMSQDLTLWYVTPEDYQAAASAVNGSLSDFTSFQTACETGENSLCLGFDESIESGFDGGAALQILYQSIKDTGISTTDRVETVRKWRAASLAALFNQSAVNPLDYRGSLKYFDNTVAEWAEFVSGSDAAVQLQTLLSGQNYQSLNQFENRIKEALILTVTRYHNGVNNIGKILKDFSDVTNITTDNETAVYQKLAGSYDSLSALLSKYDSLKKSASQGGTSSPGGNGGNGGGAKGGNAVNGSFQMSAAAEYNPAEPIRVQFIDLDTVDWAYEAIATLTDMGIISGRSGNIFAPLDTITREEFVKLLVCAAGLESRSCTFGRFADVEAGKWYEKYVCIAAETGLVNGIAEDRFGIGTNISRQDMAVLIYRALKLKGTAPEIAEQTFADGDKIAGYAKDAIGALGRGGYVNGVGDNRFNPSGTATRAEAAQILYNVRALIG